MGVCVSKGAVVAVVRDNVVTVQHADATLKNNICIQDGDNGAVLNESNGVAKDDGSTDHCNASIGTKEGAESAIVGAGNVTLRESRDSIKEPTLHPIQLYDRASPEEHRCRDLIGQTLPDIIGSNAKILHELDDEVISEINMFVFTIPAASTSDLAQHLTDSTARYLQLVGGDQHKTAIAKSYAIYAWITSHISIDTEAWKAEMESNFDYEYATDEAVLKNGITTAYGFSLLFSVISEEAGLIVETVCGNIKRWQSVTGEPFLPRPNNVHFWNAVNIIIFSIQLFKSILIGLTIIHKFKRIFFL